LSDEQDENTRSSIWWSVDSDSNVNVESDLHPEKHDLQRSLTEEGIQIDLSDEQDGKAYSSIRSSLDPDSNVNTERDIH
jgi:hypothetical protein